MARAHDVPTRRPNRLINEKSPYLQQHAYNPVEWYAWGDEALAAARREDKPIFLSIGYSTCHWCHVMEKESFENEQIAHILNSHFISIKVDREERPEIDRLYMLATQAMTGGGGWPMSVFLLPDTKPFYAGTYFPPEPRYNHPGFPELLQAIITAWSEKRQSLAESAEKITSFLRDGSKAAGRDNLEQSWSDNGFEALGKMYDHKRYGFGTTNKFPRPCTLDFLLCYHFRTKNDHALNMAESTLRAMAMGGLYDHIGGGFHRYSVDRQWRIPHFEKMLYDQAQLVVSYLNMYQLSGDDFFAAVAQETLDYVLHDLQHPEGGFYSAEDADSVNPYNPDEHGEGAFYLWKESEIRAILEENQAEDFIACYGVLPHGNAPADPAGEFTERNILYRPRPLGEAAAALNKNAEELRQSLEQSKRKLLEKRNKRVRPHLDDKIITAWNGLMVSALARGGCILGKPSYIEEAETAVDFITTYLCNGKELRRRWREGEARFDGVLEDYAFFIQGLLDLYRATHDPRHLHTALALRKTQHRLFADPDGGFFDNRESSGLITRVKETSDGAEPAGNSVAALNELRLGRLLDQQEMLEAGEKTIKAFGPLFESHGAALPFMLQALEFCLSPRQQLIVRGHHSSAETWALLREADTTYLPHLQVLLVDGSENQKLLEHYLESISPMEVTGEKVTATLCREFTCWQPTDSAKELARQLLAMQE